MALPKHKKHRDIPISDFERIFTMLGGKIIVVNSEPEKKNVRKNRTPKK